MKKNSKLKPQEVILKKDKGEISHDDISELLTIINSSIDLKDERETFNIYINKLNSEFYFRLENRYPNLTDKEKKLCALLRLKLSSKEIASILNISTKSIEVNRYRLRQKLNIPHEQRLVDVINKL